MPGSEECENSQKLFIFEFERTGELILTKFQGILYTKKSWAHPYTHIQIIMNCIISYRNLSEMISCHYMVNISLALDNVIRTND